MLRRFEIQMAALLLVVLPFVGQAQTVPLAVRGSTDAVSAATRLLEQVGGDNVWRSRVLEVTERGYLANGDEVELRIVRDFVSGRRLLERRSASASFVEWISADRAWIEDAGKRRVMPDAERIAEIYGFWQEPYAVYHKLARRDPAVRVELRENGARLFVFDANDRMLCWFRLDLKGRPIGWGNFFDGRINEHYYGPLAKVGDANLPRWGVSTTGAFRFEYVSAKLSGSPLEEP